MKGTGLDFRTYVLEGSETISVLTEEMTNPGGEEAQGRKAAGWGEMGLPESSSLPSLLFPSLHLLLPPPLHGGGQRSRGWEMGPG